MAGYHVREIGRGELGQLSKVREELEEAIYYIRWIRRHLALIQQAISQQEWKET